MIFSRIAGTGGTGDPFLEGRIEWQKDGFFFGSERLGKCFNIKYLKAKAIGRVFSHDKSCFQF